MIKIKGLTYEEDGSGFYILREEIPRKVHNSPEDFRNQMRALQAFSKHHEFIHWMYDGIRGEKYLNIHGDKY